jgi:hypothetical protein
MGARSARGTKWEGGGELVVVGLDHCFKKCAGDSKWGEGRKKKIALKKHFYVLLFFIF